MEFSLYDFGEKIKAERLKRGLKVSDVAEGTMYTNVHIYNIESGRRLPSLDTIESLLNFYGYNLEFRGVEKNG